MRELCVFTVSLKFSVKKLWPLLVLYSSFSCLYLSCTHLLDCARHEIDLNWLIPFLSNQIRLLKFSDLVVKYRNWMLSLDFPRNNRKHDFWVEFCNSICQFVVAYMKMLLFYLKYALDCAADAAMETLYFLFAQVLHFLRQKESLPDMVLHIEVGDESFF